MITARHSPWAERLFRPYVRRLVRRHFSHYYLINRPPAVDPAAALVVTPNHISWWDGFLAYVFFRPRFPNRRLYLMMLERELSRYRFFSRLGAFSINPGRKDHVMETAAYVRGLLSSPVNYVLFYPQGKIEAQTAFPPALRRGLPLFLPKSGAVQVLITGFAISWHNEKYPEIFLRFGDLLPAREVADDFSGYAKRFSKNIEDLNHAVATRTWREDIISAI